MGWLQWSQIIRMSFSLGWKRGTENAARPDSVITSYATRSPSVSNANLLNRLNGKESKAESLGKGWGLDQFKMEGQIEFPFRMIGAWSTHDLITCHHS